jgi:hypothetical protein
MARWECPKVFDEPLFCPATCDMSRIADFLLRIVTVGAGNRAARPERRQGARGFGVRLRTLRQAAGSRPSVTPVDASLRKWPVAARPRPWGLARLLQEHSHHLRRRVEERLIPP